MSRSARRLRCSSSQRGCQGQGEYRHRCDGPILRSPPPAHSSQRSHSEAEPRHVHHHHRTPNWCRDRVHNEKACGVASTQREMRSTTEGGPIVSIPTTVSPRRHFSEVHQKRRLKEAIGHDGNQSAETTSNRRLCLVSKSFIEHAERRTADCKFPGPGTPAGEHRHLTGPNVPRLDQLSPIAKRPLAIQAKL
jgi:hypothetical protein